MTYSYFSL